MVPLVARLQRLYPHGGNKGSRHTASRTKQSDAEVAARLRGDVIAPGLIQVIQHIPLASWHGKVKFSGLAQVSLAALGMAGEALPDGLLFLDTETTGLAGGTGTLPFMVCLARIQEEQLQLGQWILTGFSGEAALLETVGSWIKPAAHLVSYNGKSSMCRCWLPVIGLPGKPIRSRTRTRPISTCCILHAAPAARLGRLPLADRGAAAAGIHARKRFSQPPDTPGLERLFTRRRRGIVERDRGAQPP